MLQGGKSRLNLNVGVCIITIFWKKPARELRQQRSSSQQDCMPYCSAGLYALLLWTAGSKVRKLVLGKMVPVDSGLSRLVASFTDSLEGTLVGEIRWKDVKSQRFVTEALHRKCNSCFKVWTTNTSAI